MKNFFRRRTRRTSVNTYGLAAFSGIQNNLLQSLNVLEDDISKLIGAPPSSLDNRHGFTNDAYNDDESNGHSTLSSKPSNGQPLASHTFREVRRNLIFGDNRFEEVVLRERTSTISRQEAEMEVILDIVLRRQTKLQDASISNFSTNSDGRMKLQDVMFYVLKTCSSEHLADNLCRILLQNGVQSQSQQTKGNTPLHVAAEKQFTAICRRLLDHGALPHAQREDGTMPITIAVHKNDDDLTAVLMENTPRDRLVKFFLKQQRSNREPRFSIHDLMERRMIKTVRTVIDNLIQDNQFNKYEVIDFSLLEIDRCGRVPSNVDFNVFDDTPYQLIVRHRLVDLITHKVVQQLSFHKWNAFARGAFISSGIFYFTTMILMTAAVAMATSTSITKNPKEYRGSYGIPRIICEISSCIAVFIHIILECVKIVRHRLNYWYEPYNYLEFGGDVILLLVIPLRWQAAEVHWYVWSLGYLLWSIKFFRYAMVFSTTSNYIYMLLKVIERDVVPFFIIFCAVCFMWSGTFILAVRGENTIDNKNITSSWWRVMFTGLRIIVEAENVVDEWASTDNYEPGGFYVFATILMIAYLVVCLVIILNLLIAQMSVTHSQVQDWSEQTLLLNKAWLIRKIERYWLWRPRRFRERSYRAEMIIRHDATSHSKSVFDGKNNDDSLNMKILNSLEFMEASMTKFGNRLAVLERELVSLQDICHHNTAVLADIKKRRSVKRRSQRKTMNIRRAMRPREDSDIEAPISVNNQNSKIKETTSSGAIPSYQSTSAEMDSELTLITLPLKRWISQQLNADASDVADDFV